MEDASPERGREVEPGRKGRLAARLRRWSGPPGPFRPEFWRSPLRGPWLTSVLGLILLAGITLVAITGLVSYAAYEPRLPGNDMTPGRGWLGFYLFDWPTEPVWLYRVTQGVHVVGGLTLVPILLAKLWSVIPKLFAWPPARSVAEAGRAFETAASCANDVGLLSEEMDPATGEAIGNYPQALSHIGLINAARAIGDARRWGRPARSGDRRPRALEASAPPLTPLRIGHSGIGLHYAGALALIEGRQGVPCCWVCKSSSQPRGVRLCRTELPRRCVVTSPASRRTAVCWLAEAREVPVRRLSSVVVQPSPIAPRIMARVLPISAESDLPPETRARSRISGATG